MYHQAACFGGLCHNIRDFLAAAHMRYHSQIYIVVGKLGQDGLYHLFSTRPDPAGNHIHN